MYQYLNDVEKKRLFNVVFISLILLAVFLAVKSLNEIKQNSYIGRGEYAANVISVSGQGEVFAVPDTGSISFSVVEEGKTVKEAQDKATKKINDVLAAVRGMGIEDKDIQTTGYNSYPKYDYGEPCVYSPNGGVVRPCGTGKPTISGYEVNQSVTLKIRKVDQAGDVLTKVGTLGVSNISGVNFVIDDIDKYQAEARDKAIADAKDKANKLAKSLGVKIKGIVNFNEGGNYPVPMYYAKDAVMGMGVSAQSTVAPAPELPTGENKITSYVTITYEIE